MRVDLGTNKDGSERWAEITDVDEMPRRVSVAVLRLMPSADAKGKLSGDFSPAGMARIRDTLIAHLIEGWSFDQPLPKGVADKLQFLPNSAYKKLVDATEDHWEEVGFSRAKDGDGTKESHSGDSSSD
ncbi:hypothetical protein [Actinomadura hibisca]|uniref:hypothetical protein n=1 Tax=Actinomadura hibisca TaxID=68565 RepID=UPI00082EFE5F|nr:hypothetical protein [Actinomadura hibisca]